VVKCPVCTKIQLAYVEGPKHTSCYYCGARWIQHGAEQDSVVGRGSPASASRSLGEFDPTTEDTG